MVTEDCQVAAVRAKLADRIGLQRYGLWFGSQTELSIEADCVTVRVASAFVRDCLRKYFADDVRSSSQAVVGRDLSIEFEIEPALVLRKSRQALPEPAKSADLSRPNSSGDRSPSTVTMPCLDPLEKPADDKSSAKKIVPTSGTSRPNGVAASSASKIAAARAEFTLSRIVVGPSNEYAYRAAELTAYGRQQASPVLFCGPTGVGKTHLLRGIQLEHRRRFPRTRAIFLTAEQFTTGFIEALRGSGLPSFRQKCRGADLLIVDDLQFFVGKQRTIEELQHTVDTILAEGRQFVLGSDRGLAELRALGPELTSRLAGGLTCEISPPEFATRFGILRGLRDEMQLSIDHDVLQMIASQITAGARELRGALHRLEAMSFASNQPISREMAEEALRELTRQCTRAVRLADVQQAVCEVFGIEPAQLRSDRKGRSLHEPRMLAMWLARKYTRAVWSEIGQFFGRRSHSTVISAHHRVEKLIAEQAVIGVNDQKCNVEEAIRRVEAALRTA
ncbi:MAG: DnaA/Hda family protein [Planctomycetes bacterium]|nr:DnaA/Hda family protein [Planctomycetota bacterium]